MSTTLATSPVQSSPLKPSAWRRQKNEPEGAHLAFLWWALCEGELRPEYATKWEWAKRRKTIETYEGFESIDPGELALDAVMARVQIVFVEVMKLRELSLSTADAVLDPGQIFASLEWLQDAAQGQIARRAAVLDWKALTPDEREIMIKAKRIQDRVLAKIPT